MASVRCACIDIGSNTTRLLVAEPGGSDGRGLRPVLGQRAFTSLGAGREPGSPIPAVKIAEVAAVVAAQHAAALAAGAQHVAVVATAAVRAAPNRTALLAAVTSGCGTQVVLLDAEQEAAHAFAGATTGLDDGPDVVVGVVDVGGGSTELVLGTPAAGPSWSVSVAVGSARLGPVSLPPTAEEVAGLRAAAQRALGAVRAPAAPELALAVGGSATSLHRFVGPVLTGAAIERALLALQAGLPTGLDPRRVVLLPAGLALLEAARAALGGCDLRIAPGGLREGVLLAHLRTL